MNDKFYVGQIVRGKVIGIQPYGVFVQLSEDTQGLVHISEITNGYVKNIQDYVKVGDEVTVKIIAIDEEEGKISLSIKALSEIANTVVKHDKRPSNQEKGKQLSSPKSRGFAPLKKKLNEWIEQSIKELFIKH